MDVRVDIAHHNVARDTKGSILKDHPISDPGPRGTEEDREAERLPSKIDFPRWIGKHFAGSQTHAVRPTELSKWTKICQEFNPKGVRRGINKSQVLVKNSRSALSRQKSKTSNRMICGSI